MAAAVAAVVVDLAAADLAAATTAADLAAPTTAADLAAPTTADLAAATMAVRIQEANSPRPIVAAQSYAYRGGTQSFANRAGTWNTGNWNRAMTANNGVWNRGNGWWGQHEPNRGDFYRYGIFGWPWYAFGWGLGGWWPDYYNYAYAPYGDWYGGYYDTGVTTPYVSYSPTTATTVETNPEDIYPLNTDTGTSDFYTQAVAAFRQGDYGNATRLAGHAAIDDPRSQNVHILAMLGLFAMGEYRGAAIEAHALAATGQVPTWQTIYAFYGDVGPFTEQLRKLEKFVNANPSAGEGRFLLGSVYLMEGHKAAARAELAEALKLTPHDTLATKLLKEAGD